MRPEYEEFLTELCETKRMQYTESCRDDLTRADLVRAACNDFTKKFVTKFPHLKRVGGFYCQSQNAKRERPGTEHRWCVDVDGTVVDPTEEQFSIKGVHVPLDEMFHIIQIGRCMNCGEYIYGLKKDGPKSCCSDECATQLEDYYNRR